MEKKKFGDTIKITYLREGKRITKSVKLAKPSKKEVVDVYRSEVPPSYFITSGFIFEKLSINYINQYKSVYRNPVYTPYDLINVIDDHPDDVDEIIFIVSVLPDISNEGYQELRNVAIKEINNQKIKSFDNFITQLKSKRYAVLKDFKDNEIVIDNQLSTQRDEKIKEIYNISSLHSKDFKLE